MCNLSLFGSWGHVLVAASRDNTTVRVERGLFGGVHAEDVPLDPDGNGLELVCCVLVCGNGENLVELFQGERLGFRDEKENEEETDDAGERGRP